MSMSSTSGQSHLTIDPTGPRCVAWQVGRQGEVAGGMTQVVNAYKAWDFESVDVQVLMTRDGSSGLRAKLIYAKALFKFFTVNGTSNNLFVVHLSQGGSFVREGLLLLLAKLRGFGTVAHIHGSSFVAFAERWPRLVRRVLNSATRVIVLSDKTEICIQRMLASTRVTLLPNAVSEGNRREKERLIVFGGSVSHRKGIDVLVAAWRRSGAGKGWNLKIAGPIADSTLIPDDLRDAEFLGAISHAELMLLLERSSVAVLPSRDEAMPMFILEAMGRDNCVISTRVGGIPAVLENGRGVLVDAGDIEQLAQAIEAVISDHKFRESVACTGRVEFDRSYSATAIYPQVEKLWLSALPVVNN